MAAIEFYHDPGTREIRAFAGLGLPLLCCVLGALGFWKFDAPQAGIAIWGAGALLSLTGLFLPRVLKPVLIGLMILSFPIRWVVFHVTLAALYFLVFTPIGLLLRLGPLLHLGKPSALRAFRDTSAPSYWQARQPAARFAQYFKQH